MQLQMFKNENLGQVRVLGNNENPLFCLRDICEVLEHTNSSRMLEAINAEFGKGVTQSYPLQTNGGIQQATFITEPQLYFVLMRSDKPKAKPFRQWVVSVVLPSIRKQGYYEHSNALINELRDSNLSKDRALKENECLKDEIIALQNKIIVFYESKEREVPKHYNTWLNSEEKSKILELFASGKSVSQIQKILKRSEYAVRSVIGGNNARN
ncbi:BRO family protein [uncultured Helicobacter sp.]|uniref:BRO-N domain-containing protein n=4 Tax=Helicobacter TaxID=209 RepID=UPI0025EAEBA1|nr:BRO family protein [uncultured Helicobacter sp.]